MYKRLTALIFSVILLFSVQKPTLGASYNTKEEFKAAYILQSALPYFSDVERNTRPTEDWPLDPVIIKEARKPDFVLTEDEIDLISVVVMAEAEGECEEGKRLVADVILNRVAHPRFPSSVYDVVYQRNQFTSMWNGRAKRCYVREDIRELVVEECVSRYNKDAVFFRTQHYSSYGSPLFQVGNHYFSKY